MCIFSAGEGGFTTQAAADAANTQFGMQAATSALVLFKVIETLEELPELNKRLKIVLLNNLLMLIPKELLLVDKDKLVIVF